MFSQFEPRLNMSQMCLAETAVVDLEPESSMQIQVDIRTFEGIYKELTNVGANTSSTRMAFAAVIKKGVENNKDIYKRFLLKCQQHRCLVDKYSGYLKKVEALDKFNLPFANQMTNFELTADSDSLFNILSVTIFGTTIYSQCLQVVFVRHVVQNWSRVKTICKKNFYFSINCFVQAVISGGKGVWELMLPIMSRILQRPIFVTSIENDDEDMKYTTVFLADKQHCNNQQLWLIRWKRTFLVRFPKYNFGLIGIVPFMAITWGLNEATQIKDKFEKYPNVIDHPTGEMLPSVGPLNFLNQKLYMQAKDVIELANKHDFNPPIKIVEYWTLMQKISDFGVDMFEDIRKLKKDKARSMFSWLWKQKCTTCASWDRDLENVTNQIQNVYKENGNGRVSGSFCCGCPTCAYENTLVHLFNERACVLIGMVSHCH